jgi:hypothetical protein
MIIDKTLKDELVLCNCGFSMSLHTSCSSALSIAGIVDINCVIGRAIPTDKDNLFLVVIRALLDGAFVL